MTSKALRIAYCVILAALAGCANLAPLLSRPTPVPVSQPTTTPRPVPTITSTPPSLIRVLRVWLPPRFDPEADTPAAKLLKQRLADFESAHQGLKIEVRIKAEAGETSLLNTLTITSQAAPSALPDLIALSRPDLETAVLKGLLHPMDGLSTMLNDPNWYGYARDMGHIQNIGYGLPFAGEVLVLVHRPALNFKTWDDILASKQLVLFPGGDQQSLVALTLYVSAGGKLVDDQGQPILEEAPLTQTLTLIQNGLDGRTFTTALLNLKTDDQSFQGYRDARANAVLTWSANYQVMDGILQPVPSLNNTAPMIFANGWIWALAGSTPENQQAATELAEYLMDDKFLNEWTPLTGYYPTRFLQSSEMNTMLGSAQMLPAKSVLSTLGPIMNQALSRVLNGEQVQAVVRSVMEQFK